MNLRMKKILAGLLAAMMVLSCAPVSVFAADEDEQTVITTVDYATQFEAAVLENSGTAAYTIDKSVDSTSTSELKAAVQAILEEVHADLLSTWDPATYLTTGVKITYYDIGTVVAATEYEAGSVTVKISYKDESTYAADTSAQSVEATFILAPTGTTSADRFAEFEAAVAANIGTEVYTIDSSVDATNTTELKAAIQAILEEAHADLLKTFDSSTYLTTGLSLTYYDILDTTLATEYEDGSVTVKISYKDVSSYATDTSAQSVEATFILETAALDYAAEFEAAVLAASGTEVYTIDKSVDVTDTAAVKAAVQAILEEVHADLLSTFDPSTYITTGVKLTYFDIIEVVAATEYEDGSVTVKISYKDESTYATDSSAKSVEATFIVAANTVDRAAEFGEAVAALSGTDAYTISKDVDSTDTAALKAAVQEILEDIHGDLLSTFDPSTYITTGVKMTYFDIIEVVAATEYEDGSVTVKVSYKDESTYAADTSAQSVEVVFILEKTGFDYLAAFEAELLDNSGTEVYTIDKSVDVTDTAAVKAAVQAILEEEHAELLSTFDVETYITRGIKITYYDVVSVTPATEAQTGSVVVKVSYKDNSTYASDTSAHSVEVTFIVEAATIDRATPFGEAMAELSGTAAYTIDKSVDATDTGALKAAAQAVLEEVHADLLSTFDPDTLITTGVKITYFDIIDVVLATEYETGSATIKVSYKDESTYAADTQAQSVEVTFILEPTADVVIDTVEMTTYTSTYDTIKLNWEAVEGATGYRIYMLVDGEYVKVDQVAGLTTSIDGLSANSEYSFAVKAFFRWPDSSITWGETSEDFATSTATTQTEITSFTRTYDAIRVNWDSVDGADGYRVYMLVGNEIVKVATVYGEDTTTYRLSGLDANTSYVFYVNSFVRDDDGVAHFLTLSDYYVAATRTEQVEMTTYTRTDDAIRVNWESVSGADGYRVYMLVDGELVKVATVYGEDTTTARISELESETGYTFYVNAFVRNDDGVAQYLTISDAFAASTI